MGEKGGLGSNVSPSERSPQASSLRQPLPTVCFIFLPIHYPIYSCTYALHPLARLSAPQEQAYLSVLFTAVCPAPRTVPGTLKAFNKYLWKAHVHC